ncbi:MAG: hypothetical protein KIS86_11185 [Devosia sp.]|nr:hypothetical protein [Devosia sp.]
MSLEDLFSIRRHRQQSLVDNLADQLDQLRREFGHLGRAVSREARDTAGDFGREAAKQGAWLAGAASRNAMRSARAIRRDPLPAIAVVGTALLLAHLLSGRK